MQHPWSVSRRIASGLIVAAAVAVLIPVSWARSNSHITALTAGEHHSHALSSDGTVWSWGNNNDGDLGIGQSPAVNRPVPVPMLKGVVAIDAGRFHVVALERNGTVWTWGDNSRGQLGNGTTVDSDVPVRVLGLDSIVKIAAGSMHSLALRRDGTLWAWGDNPQGELGTGTTALASTLPLPVLGPDGLVPFDEIVEIAAGVSNSFAARRDGSLWAWGQNSKAQLGVGYGSGLTLLRKPARVKGPGGADYFTGAVAIAPAAQATLALRFDGTVFAWGSGGAGTLGNGTWDSSVYPVQVSGADGVGHLEGVVAIAAGNHHCLAVLGDGSMWSWGWNGRGQIGNGTVPGNYNAPVRVSPPIELSPFDPTDARSPDAVIVGAGAVISLGASERGTAWAWGYAGTSGSAWLGNGSDSGSTTPVQIFFLRELDR